MQNSQFFVSIMLKDKNKLKIKYIDLCEMENSQISFFWQVETTWKNWKARYQYNPINSLWRMIVSSLYYRNSKR